MAKIEITDEMVERAARAAFGNLERARRFETATPLTDMRKALEAALNPPHEHVWAPITGWSHGNGGTLLRATTTIRTRYSLCSCGAAMEETITEPAPRSGP